MNNEADFVALKDENLSGFLAESFVDFSHEVSLIGVRSLSGETRFYDLCHNKHEAGILRETRNIKGDPIAAKAQASLSKIMEHFNNVGVLTVEFFVKDGDLIFNEMAPRVHNSGHWTIEGAYTSQFENHIRAISGLPLGSTESRNSCVMTNCVGEMLNRLDVLSRGGHYHDYQKSPRPGRKLGHVNFLSP